MSGGVANRRLALDSAAEHCGVRWSPDGTQIAWSAPPRPVDSDSSGIWVIPAGGGKARRLAADGAWVAWHPDGFSLIFARYEEHRGLWRVPVTGGPPEQIQQLSTEIWEYDVQGIELARTVPTMVIRLQTATTSLYLLEKP